MHSQGDGPIDQYLGSGKLLHKAIAKYGKDNFIKEIVLYCSSREELAKRESEFVTDTLVDDYMYYNLKRGGEGGSSGLSEESKLKISKANKGRLAGERNPAFGRIWTEEMTKAARKNHSLYGKISPQAIKVSVNGKTYDSIHLANEISGVKHIRRKLDSKNYLNIRYVDESRNTHKEQRFVVIHGKYYSSLRTAERITGEPRKIISRKIADCATGYSYDILFTYIKHDEE